MTVNAYTSCPLTPRGSSHSLTVVTPTRSERRRYGRIRLETPLHGRFGAIDVRILQLSMSGFLVAQEGRSAEGDPRTLLIDWNGAPIELECEVVRSHLYRLSRALGEKSVYHTGLRIVGFANGSFDALRGLIHERVMRALEEQKANARGIPPLSVYMYQPEKGELFRRCEYIDGVWQKSETSRPQQPPHGFTVSAEVEPRYIEMLCDTWVRTTAEGRRLTQLLAELSVSRAEGIPTRRYVP